MSGFSIGLLFVPLLALIGLVAVLRSRPVIRIGHNDHTRLAAIARHTSRWRLAGLGVGVIGAIACIAVGDGALGRIVALAPAVFVGSLLVGTVIGEYTARSPQGLTREASLTTRTVGQVLTRSWLVVAGVSAAFLALVLGVGTALGRPDDLGRAGRALARTCTAPVATGETAVVGFTRGPWPGSFYTVPLGLSVVVLVVLAGLALRAITLRRGAGVASEALDLVTRRWAAGNVLLACTIAFLLISGGLALPMGTMLLGIDTCRMPIDGLLGWFFFVTGIVAFGAGLTLIGALLAGPRLVVDDVPGASPEPPATAGVPVR